MPARRLQLATTSGKAAVEATVRCPARTANQAVSLLEPEPPTPLDVRCDAKMQVYLPKPVVPVAIGPPAPPGPTIVLFERNVVVLRGQPDDQPDQLTCDTLKLHLVPGDKSPEKVAQTTAPSDTTEQDDVSTEPAESENDGLFGGLTLQRAYATGHVVWLHLPQQGIKLRCNELWHVRRLPYQPDMTYFRGDATRPLEIEKVDIAYDPKTMISIPARSRAVTNIWTIDATLFDNGTGTDTANVVAHGPGRLETRPDRDQPIERIAIWQDKFILQNELGPTARSCTRSSTSRATARASSTKLKDTQLDSAQLIKVTLKPKTVSKPASATQQVCKAPMAAQTSSGLQIERLVAVQDVHLTAPAKTMNAKHQLYAEFFEVEQPPAAAATAVPPAPQCVKLPRCQCQTWPSTRCRAAAGPDTCEGRADEETDGPSMTGTAERIWAKVALEPNPRR